MKPRKHRLFTVLLGLMILMVVLTIALQLATPITSNDIWWQMAYGREILRAGTLILDHSIFSWTPALSNFVYNSWLAQIIFHGIYQLSGVEGLIALRYLVFFIIFWLAWRFAREKGVAGHPLAWAIVLLAFSFMWPKANVKPELFSLLLMGVSTWLYFHMRNQGERAWYLPYLFPLILVLWINLHGAFFLAAPLMLAVLIGELLNAKFSPGEALPPRLRKHLLIGLVLCLPALLLNPYGYQLPLTIVLDVMNKATVGMANISDYLPTYQYNAPPYYLLDYLVIAMVIFVFLVWQKLKERQTDWVVTLAFLAYSFLFIQMIRVVHFLGPVFLFSALDLLGRKERSWAWPRNALGMASFTGISFALVAFIGWRAIQGHGCSLRDPAGHVAYMFDESSASVATEAAYIAEHLPGKRIGNIYRDGGVLIYKLWPEKKVMIDPRAFPYKSWIERYFQFAEDGRDVDKFVSGMNADFWLINYAKLNPFQWFARSEEWRPLYFGPRAAIFVPTEEAPEAPVVAPEIASMRDQNSLGLIFVNALFFDDLGFASHIYKVARQNIQGNCGNQKRFLDEMRDTLAGHQAFRKGDYLNAARLFVTGNKIFRNHDKASESYMLLAGEARKRGELKKMREHALQAYLLLPSKRMIDLYNMAIADWLYRHSPGALLLPPEDDLSWSRITDYIIDHEDELPPERAFIKETAHAMLEGTFDGEAPFVPRYLAP